MDSLLIHLFLPPISELISPDPCPWLVSAYLPHCWTQLGWGQTCDEVLEGQTCSNQALVVLHVPLLACGNSHQTLSRWMGCWRCYCSFPQSFNDFQKLTVYNQAQIFTRFVFHSTAEVWNFLVSLILTFFLKTLYKTFKEFLLIFFPIYCY